MRRSLHRLVPALLVVATVSAGCGGEADPTGPEQPSSQAPSSSATDGADELPVAGAGADVDPADAGAWCGAVTPAQLGGAAGFEVAAIRSDGAGVQSCTADLPGAELVITWGSEPTRKSFERYAAGFDRPAGVYDATDVTLASGQPAVVALQDSSTTAFAGTVADGRLIQVTVIAVAAQDADLSSLGEAAQQVLAVYAG